MPRSTKILLRALGWFLAAGIIIILCLLRWGADILIAQNPSPGPVDAAIVLQGSILGENSRLAAAMELLQQRMVNRVLLGVPRQSYWGQAIPPMAREYLEKTYGADMAAHVDFCEFGQDVDSTLQEAEADLPCIREHHWKSIMIVTSDYHTRRAGMIWNRILKREWRDDPRPGMWIVGANDPEFEAPWWRHRRSAKTWLMEATKLAWASFAK